MLRRLHFTLPVLIAVRIPVIAAIIPLIFFFSGWSSLVYQVTWVRQLGLIFGVSTYAAGTVLTAFFGGLALGSWCAGRWLVHYRRPLRIFALLELVIAGYALCVPGLLDMLMSVYTATIPADVAPSIATLTRFVGSSLILLIPTTLMGASLPLVVAGKHRSQSMLRSVSQLYTVNTLGAVAGAAWSGLYAIGKWGLATTTWVAVAINILVALGAWIWDWSQRASTEDVEASPRTASDTNAVQRVMLAGLFLSGLSALGYEIVWIRILSGFLQRTVTAYTIMLCCVLLGIALGSWLLQRRTAPIRRPIRALISLELGVAALNCLAIPLIYAAQGQLPALLTVFVSALIIPNVMLGASVPIAISVYHSARGAVGRSVGDVYSANVLGGVLGSALTTFILLPLLGSQRTLLVLAAVTLLVAVLCWLIREPAGETKPIARGLWLVAATLLGSLVVSPHMLSRGLAQGAYAGQQVRFEQEDIEGVVTVTESSGLRSIYVNGLLESTDAPALVTVHRRLGHLPLILHPHPQRALIVGLGGGTTAGAMSQHLGVELTVIELIPSIPQGAALFAHSNYDVVNQPNVSMEIDDGRNRLLLDPTMYDVIEADIILPHRAGANNLYAREYYELVAKRLKPGGIVSQWFPNYLPEDEYKMLLRTFVSVFPTTTLWENGRYAIAMPDGIQIDTEQIRAKFGNAVLASILTEAGYSDADTFINTFTMGPDRIRSFVGDGPILTDNHPYLEYRRDSSGKAPAMLQPESVVPYLKNR